MTDPMKTCSFTLAALFACLTLISGCQTNARRVEAGGEESVVSLNRIDIAEYRQAAGEMVQSLIESGVLSRTERIPVIAVSRIRNNTTQQIDTDLLTKKIRVDLNRSGRALTSTTIGLGGTAEDPLAKGEMQRKEFFNDGESSEEGEAAGPARPDYTLSGKIIEQRARAGRVREVTYVFQLSLTDTTRGVAAWEDERSFAKQGTRNAVGW